VPLPHSANRFMGEKSSAPAAGPSHTSPPWSGSGTGEHRRRRGGGRERSEPGNHRDFPAVLRTAPPRHFVPLPHSADRFVGEKSSTAANAVSPRGRGKTTHKPHTRHPLPPPPLGSASLQRRYLPPCFAWGTNPQKETPPSGDGGVHRYQVPTTR